MHSDSGFLFQVVQDIFTFGVYAGSAMLEKMIWRDMSLVFWNFVKDTCLLGFNHRMFV
jgi:hypothetical protein